MSQENSNTPPAQEATPQTENKGLTIPLEYSDLDSTPADSSPTEKPDAAGSDNERSPYIPRSRFDEVNTQKNEAQQQLGTLQQQNQLMLQQLAQLQTQQQPQLSPAGMQMQTPQAQPQQPQTAQPMSEEEYKGWQEKIANGGPKVLAEFIQAVGAPLVQQQLQAVQQQLQPLQQGFRQQVVSSYEQGRMSQDPTFGQLKPFFDQTLNRAVQLNPGLQLNPQNLSVIEQVARVQAQNYGVQFQAQPAYQPQQAPFTERPGAAAPQSQPPGNPTLTARELQVAQSFGMTPQEYAASYKEFS